MTYMYFVQFNLSIILRIHFGKSVSGIYVYIYVCVCVFVTKIWQGLMQWDKNVTYIDR